MKKLILLCCFSFLFLQGCVAVAVVGGAAAGTAVIADKRTIKTMNRDRRATETAQALINHSKRLKGRSHISIATFNHVMLMVGQAQTPELREYAYNLIQGRVKYVKQIYNEVTVDGSSSFLQRTNDTWLTTKVKSALLGAKHVHSGQIKVVTESSTVFLMGLVTQKQGELSANTARRVTGVRRVVKVFQYID